jgi:exopolysaccharide production protein ExoZ
LLFNLQILRGMAALGVVFYHTNFRLAGDWRTEFFGVATFFVISGFIMCFITRDNADDFLKMRFIRIVPMYWLGILALLFLMFRFALFNPATWLNAPSSRPEEPLWSYVGRSVLFLPSEGLPILGVGWTLNFEIYFYVVFAVALWINRRLAPLIVAAFLMAVFYSDGTVCTLFVCHYYSHHYVHFFLAGIVVYYAWRFVARYLPRMPTIIVGGSVIAISYGSQFVHPWWAQTVEPQLGWWWSVAPPVIIVACALFAETSSAVVRWKPLILIGDASYAIYLTHTILFEASRVSMERWFGLPAPKESVVMMLIYLVVAVVAGVAVHLLVEKPMLRFIRARVFPAGRSVPPAKVASIPEAQSQGSVLLAVSPESRLEPEPKRAGRLIIRQ